MRADVADDENLLNLLTGAAEGAAHPMTNCLPRAFSILCVVLVMAGCSTAPSRPRQPSPTVWDPMTWKPPSQIAVPTMSDDEMAKRRRAELAQFAKLFDLKPTRTPPLERWTLPDEQAIPVSTCLREKGWKASAAPNGGLAGTVAEPQRKAQHLAQYECMARFSIDPRFLKAPTPQMYAAVWAYFKDYGIPCLAHYGLTPDEPLPTRETFIATKGRFSLYPSGVRIPESVQVACPDLPPTRAMFGLK